MDEKRKLKVLAKSLELQEAEKEPPVPKFSHLNQTNPIYKHLGKFHNARIGEKFSISDLLR